MIMRMKFVNCLVVVGLAALGNTGTSPALADSTTTVETRSVMPAAPEYSTTTTRTTTVVPFSEATVIERPVAVEKSVILSHPVVVEKKQTIYTSTTRCARPSTHHVAIVRRAAVHHRVIASSHSAVVKQMTITKTIERPVVFTRVVKQPVYIDRVVEKPVFVEKTRVIERPMILAPQSTIIERQITSPVVVEEKVKHHRGYDTIKIKESY
jgi:hypothetical protein